MPKLTKRPLSVLSDAYAVDLLLYLQNKQELMATQLLEVHTNYHTIFAVARSLADAGLVEVKVVRSPRITYTFRLTTKGKKVAEKLKEARELIGE